MRVFAEHAWLGSQGLMANVLLTYEGASDSLEMEAVTATPDNVRRVQWLLPGFVNAHCHLEYSSMAGQLPRGAIPFGEWMQAIMAARPQTDDELARRLEKMEAAAKALLEGGCTTVIDSTTDGTSGPVLARAGVKHFLFHEVLGLSQLRAEPMWNRAVAKLREIEQRNGFYGAGINPHAPYSVGPWLRDQVRALPQDIPLAWHLGETREEEQLFQSGDGSIAKVLTCRGMDLPFTEIPKTSAAGFLRDEKLLDRCDVAFHGNTLSDAEAKFFSAPRGLVHCPATHRWFQREPVPLEKWLQMGVNVCLGTDSLASSDSLSMMEMMRTVLQDHPRLTGEAALQMACVNPRKLSFLREPDGALTDFIALETPVEGDSLRDVLVCAETQVAQVWIDGVERIQVV